MDTVCVVKNGSVFNEEEWEVVGVFENEELAKQEILKRYPNTDFNDCYCHWEFATISLNTLKDVVYY